MGKCLRCGVSLSGSKKNCGSTECNPVDYCVDCGKKISGGAVRCRVCNAKYPEVRRKIGISVSKTKSERNYDYIFKSEHWRKQRSRITKEAWRKGSFGGRSTDRYRKMLSKGVKEAHRRGDYSDVSDKIKEAWAHGCYEHVHTAEWRKNKSEDFKRAHRYGRYKGIYTEEVRDKMSKSAKLSRARGTHSHIFTPEVRHKISTSKVIAWESGVYDGVFKSPTAIEIQVADALDVLGLKHISQFRPKNVSFVYDEFVYPNMLIEVHGSYWHSSKESQERDLEKARWAHQNGYKFVTIWDFHLKEYGADFLVEKWIVPALAP